MATRKTAPKNQLHRQLAGTNNCACFNVRKAARAVTQHFASFMNVTGITESQFSVLSVLAQAGPLTMGRLADMLLMDRTSLTRTLRPLQHKSYVDVVPGLKDSRTREVHITEMGLDALSEALPHWSAAQKSLLSAFGANDWRDTKARLELLISASQKTQLT